MKFEFRDTRKQISDQEIINDLRTVANSLGKKSISLREYSKKNGAQYSSDTALRRFGDWDGALQKAGLDFHKNKFGKKTREELIDDIIRVAKEQNNSTITFKDYRQFGKYDGKTIHRKFGGWIAATKEANLEIERIYSVSTEQLFQNLLEIWTQLGRQPKRSEIITPMSKFHIATYIRKFGSWQLALKEFIEYSNSNAEVENDIYYNNKPLVEITKDESTIEIDVSKAIKRTPREPNLRLRYSVLKRDKFSCKKCGRSPAKDHSTILHIDHIIPWSKGGETVIENLEVLCEQCNEGKSNVL